MGERTTTSHSHIPMFHQQTGEPVQVLSGWKIEVVQLDGSTGLIEDVVSWEINGGFLLCDMRDGATAIFPDSFPCQYIMTALWEIVPEKSDQTVTAPFNSPNVAPYPLHEGE